MTSPSIKDLIFSEDATLFEVLDQLQVPELLQLNTQVDTNTTLIAQYKSQLDDLARKQDNFEATTTANFIAVNTTLENIDNEIDSLTSSVSMLQLSVHNLEISMNSLTDQVGEISSSLSSITSQLATLTDTVATQEIIINRLVDSTFSGVRILKGLTTLFIWDYANNRFTLTDFNLSDDWMLMGKVYRSTFQGSWLSGDYDFTITSTRDSTNPSPYSAPLVSGQFYWFNWSNPADPAYFHVQVYFYT